MLIVLRGNSGSGKSTTARTLQQFGPGVAWVEQDYLRRIMLAERDLPGGRNIGLIEANVRYCLEAGFVTVLEGILYQPHYGKMLERLHRDYGGHWFYFAIPFDETARRHATRPQAARFTVEMMRGWYHERDVLPFVSETVIGPELTLEQSVDRIAQLAGLNRS